MAQEKNRTGAGDLGIDLGGDDDAELFRWLVACVLFGARIRQELAAEGFRALDAEGLLTSTGLRDAGWQHVSQVLGSSGYGRYDESKARELVQLGHDVLERYDGHLSRLPEGATSTKELKARLQQFKGVGPTAADIFLREVGPSWKL